MRQWAQPWPQHSGRDGGQEHHGQRRPCGGDLLGEQTAHAVADDDRGLPDAVVGVEGDGEALLDAGAGQHGVVGGFAAGHRGRVHGVSRGFEESRPRRQQ